MKCATERGCISAISHGENFSDYMKIMQIQIVHSRPKLNEVPLAFAYPRSMVAKLLT